MNTLRKIGVAVTLSLAVNGAVVAESKFDPFYLPQANQPFEGTVDTRIGTLEFNNQYPSKDSMQTILDSMDFHGATQAFCGVSRWLRWRTSNITIEMSSRFDKEDWFSMSV